MTPFQRSRQQKGQWLAIDNVGNPIYRHVYTIHIRTVYISIYVHVYTWRRIQSWLNNKTLKSRRLVLVYT